MVDKKGMAVAMTTTLNTAFGNAVMVSGFLLNNEMDDFTAKPGAPNAYGLVQSAANKIAPGKRMLSSMSPTIVEDRKGDLAIVVSGQGGARIYDPLGRITEHLDPQQRLTRYFNDPAGDRLRTSIVEGVRQLVVGGDVAEDEWRREGVYEGTYYRFDRAGNLTHRRDDQRELDLVWDANQRLIESYSNGTITRYGYDPLGRRLFKETGEIRTQFFWDGDALAWESEVVLESPKEAQPTSKSKVVALAKIQDKATLATPHKTREYVFYPETFEPLALIEGTGDVRILYHYHNDPNGSPTRLTDASGEVKWAASYTAWGGVFKLHVNGIDEEDWIRKGGGPETQGGSLENRRYEMNPDRYTGAGGTEPKPT